MLCLSLFFESFKWEILIKRRKLIKKEPNNFLLGLLRKIYNEKSHQPDEILTDILLRDPDFQKVQTIYNFFYLYLKGLSILIAKNCH